MEPVNQAVFAEMESSPAVQRYSFGARATHWVVAITFILLTISGLAFFHPNMAWMGNLFGSLTWARILHPFIGVVMFVAFCGLLVRFWHHNMIDKHDVKWLLSIQYIISGREDLMPPANEFNAGQKMLFWMLLVLMLGLMGSGIVIWRSYFSHLFSVDLVRFALLMHAVFAFGLMCMIIVHVYASFLAAGSIKAMMYGKVSYGWLRHNHRRFYDEVVAKEEKIANAQA